MPVRGQNDHGEATVRVRDGVSYSGVMRGTNQDVVRCASGGEPDYAVQRFVVLTAARSDPTHGRSNR